MKKKEVDISEGTLKAYSVGFFSCVLLTLASYFIVSKRLLSLQSILISIVGLGVLQAFVQLIVFLHLGDEQKPRWNLFVFLFMALVIGILVFGSVWIMFSLNARVMPEMH